jgi:hypothetical protein
MITACLLSAGQEALRREYDKDNFPMVIRRRRLESFNLSFIVSLLIK